MADTWLVPWVADKLQTYPTLPPLGQRQMLSARSNHQTKSHPLEIRSCLSLAQPVDEGIGISRHGNGYFGLIGEAGDSFGYFKNIAS